MPEVSVLIGLLHLPELLQLLYARRDPAERVEQRHDLVAGQLETTGVDDGSCAGCCCCGWGRGRGLQLLQLRGPHARVLVRLLGEEDLQGGAQAGNLKKLVNFFPFHCLSKFTGIPLKRSFPRPKFYTKQKPSVHLFFSAIFDSDRF